MATQIGDHGVKKNDALRNILLTAFFIGFVVDVFFFSSATLDFVGDLRLFSLLLLWLFVSKLYRLTSVSTFKLTLVFLFILFFLFIFFRDKPCTERIASWIYVYLFIGVIQQLFESGKEK